MSLAKAAAAIGAVTAGLAAGWFAAGGTAVLAAMAAVVAVMNGYSKAYSP
ncbi:MAG TPA: hypothetical protein VMV17_09685 [Streptosporangiaceae bacterium]|nr:hypothetical protein [Streptosporangiaceae bacterium]